VPKYDIKWHKYAQDIFIEARGICSPEVIQRGLLALVERKVLTPRDLPGSISSDPDEVASVVFKYYRDNKETWQAELDKGLEDLWHLGLADDLPPDLIARIIDIQKDAYYPLTNRRVKWIKRLHKVVSDTHLLKMISFYYAYLELQAVGKPFNTVEFDKYLGDKASQKQLLEIFISMVNTDALSLLTHGELTQIISRVFIKGKHAYAIYQDGKIDLGFGSPSMLLLQGFITPEQYKKGGEVKLAKGLIPTPAQKKKLVKDTLADGNLNGNYFLKPKIK